MTQQPAGPPKQREGQTNRNMEQSVSDFNASVAALRTEADRARGIFGFGRRIIIPPDEIHFVVGDGRHIYAISGDRKIFGQTADRPSRYWLNQLTQVIKLKQPYTGGGQASAGRRVGGC